MIICINSQEYLYYIATCIIYIPLQIHKFSAATNTQQVNSL